MKAPTTHPQIAPVPYRAVKRAFDVVGSAAGLVVLSPVLAGVAVAVKATSRGPVIFKQKRFGKNRVPFVCYKFRTMKQDTPTDIPTLVMAEDPSVMTPIGATLRKWSLDELPQMVNILKGDMSFIGPRPMILAEAYQIDAREKYGANDIRPGLSGWAQVNGRDAVDVEKKAYLDGEYRANMSIAFDAKIFFLSIYVVLTRNGYKSVEKLEGEAAVTAHSDEIGGAV